MHMNRPTTKLNAKIGLVVTSILYLVNAGVGTVLAVKENLPSMTFITSGKPPLAGPSSAERCPPSGSGAAGRYHLASADDSFRRRGDRPPEAGTSSRS